MKKRTFLKISSVLATGSLLSPVMSCEKKERPKNWAGNLQYSTATVHESTSVDEVRALVKKLDKLRVLGTRHCFNSIADSEANLLSTSGLDQVISLDKENSTVTAGAGIRYGQLAEYLQREGYALHNLASLPHISVAGACATATHGSGVKNGNLASALAGMEIVTADGEVRILTRKDPDFSGAVVGLGALGVVTKVTLDIQPTFEVRQDVCQNLPLAQLKDHFDSILSAGYSVSLFTDWTNENISQVWIKSRPEEGKTFEPGSDFFASKVSSKNLHPIEAISAVNCTDQMGVFGPWHERLPHFKMGFTPSSGEELQAEYFVPMEKGWDAIAAIFTIHEKVTPVLLISEVRTIAADDLWMSPCNGQPSMAIHFTLKPDWEAVQKLLPQIEAALSPFNARPHWGKLFTMEPGKLKSLYPRLADFQKLVDQYDPNGKFRNAFIEGNVM